MRRTYCTDESSLLWVYGAIYHASSCSSIHPSIFLSYFACWHQWRDWKSFNATVLSSISLRARCGYVRPACRWRRVFAESGHGFRCLSILVIDIILYISSHRWSILLTTIVTCTTLLHESYVHWWYSANIDDFVESPATEVKFSLRRKRTRRIWTSLFFHTCSSPIFTIFLVLLIVSYTSSYPTIHSIGLNKIDIKRGEIWRWDERADNSAN